MSFIKDLFSSPDKVSTPSQIVTPGYTVDAGGNLTRSGSAGAAFDTRLPRILSDLDTTRAGTTPGFGALTAARVQSAKDAGAAGISNLRGDLARRKVLGSSFASDALSRAELEVGKAVGEAKAQSFLEELDAMTKILQQEYSTITGALQVNLAELGAGSQAVAALNGLSIDAQNLYAQQLAGQGQLLGTLAGLGVSSFASGGMFAPGGTFGGADATDELLRQILEAA